MIREIYDVSCKIDLLSFLPSLSSKDDILSFCSVKFIYSLGSKELSPMLSSLITSVHTRMFERVINVNLLCEIPHKPSFKLYTVMDGFNDFQLNHYLQLRIDSITNNLCNTSFVSTKLPSHPVSNCLFTQDISFLKDNFTKFDRDRYMQDLKFTSSPLYLELRLNGVSFDIPLMKSLWFFLTKLFQQESLTDDICSYLVKYCFKIFLGFGHITISEIKYSVFETTPLKTPVSEPPFKKVCF